jgi:hypothetical protein
MSLPVAGRLLGDDSTSLRTALADLERQLTELAALLEKPEATKAMAGLRESWTAFVDLLDLPAPVERRECPVCKHLGMRTALRCGYCWTKFAASA